MHVRMVPLALETSYFQAMGCGSRDQKMRGFLLNQRLNKYINKLEGEETISFQSPDPGS